MRPLLLLVLALMAAPADAAPRRHGRVVRIERPRHVESGPIHVCMMISVEESKLVCFGQEPAAGSTLDLV
ncbi:MAG TPA: hypothetical protein VMZ28_04035, partial [Kofleriaceae bacterium]|nr:hypothetical protein [Kofleriaceae bacterium]